MYPTILHDLGLIAYEEAWQMQKDIFNGSIQQKLIHLKPEQQLLLCEHPHVYTLGKSAQSTNLLLSETELQHRKIQVFDIERGGDITYHGPGQLVAYPIFDIEQLGIGVRQFVYNIEQCIINVLLHYGIRSERIKDRIGIWIDKDTDRERKIAAIGIKCSRHVTMHGLALNVNTDLDLFNQIIPCGIKDKEVSSMEKELGRKIPMHEIKKELVNEFSTIFDLNLISK
jgi:lipoyl(octanoyl) transferase